MSEFGELESQSRQLVKDGHFADARRVAIRAIELIVGDRRAKILLADVDAAERRPRRRRPGSRPSPSAAFGPSRPGASVPASRADRVGSPRRARGDAVLRDIVRAYLGGDYTAALSASAAAGESAPGRVSLYAACSEAALGLLDSGTSDARFARAREFYAKAQASGQVFTADRRVISPRVWDVIATP